VAARIAVALVAAGLLVFGIAARVDSDRCQDEGAAFFRIESGEQTRLSAEQAREFADACRGSHFLALAADFLVSHDQVVLAQSLARTATHREPDNFEGWLALSRAQKAAGLEASAARALRRAVALNPRLGRTPPRPG
jgi:hypothetical protein